MVKSEEILDNTCNINVYIFVTLWGCKSVDSAHIFRMKGFMQNKFCSML